MLVRICIVLGLALTACGEITVSPLDADGGGASAPATATAPPVSGAAPCRGGQGCDDDEDCVAGSCAPKCGGASSQGTKSRRPKTPCDSITGPAVKKS